MPQTVADVHLEARALLNDAVGDLFTDAVLLPFTKKAYQEVQDELALNGLSEVEEGDYTDDVPIGDKIITLPSDFLSPIALFEKGVLRPDTEYVKMRQSSWEPSYDPDSELNQWRFAEGEIKVPGATTVRTVKLVYVKFLAALIDVTSVVPVINWSAYISARVAAIAAFSIGANLDRSRIHQSDADIKMKILIATAVKRVQSQGTRRQPFRHNG